MSGANPLPNPPVAWTDLKTGQPTQAFYQYVFQLDAAVGGAVAGVALGVATNGLKLLNTLTASSSASLDDTADITAAYDLYMIELVNLIPATNNVALMLQYQVSGSFQTTGYLSTITIIETSAANFEQRTDSVALSASSVSSLGVSSSGNGVSGIIYLHSPNNTAHNKASSGSTSYLSTIASTVCPGLVGGEYNGSTAAVTGVRIKFSSGNIASGLVKIYGIKT